MLIRRVLPILLLIDLVLAVIVINHKLLGRGAIEIGVDNPGMPSTDGAVNDARQVLAGREATRSEPVNRDVIRVDGSSRAELCQAGAVACTGPSVNIIVLPGPPSAVEAGDELPDVLDMAAVWPELAHDEAPIVLASALCDDETWPSEGACDASEEAAMGLIASSDAAEDSTCDHAITEALCDNPGLEASVGAADPGEMEPSLTGGAGASTSSDMSSASLPVPSSPLVGDRSLNTLPPRVIEVGPLGPLNRSGSSGSGQADADRTGRGGDSDGPGLAAPAPKPDRSGVPPAGNWTEAAQTGGPDDLSRDGSGVLNPPLYVEQNTPLGLLDGNTGARTGDPPAPSQTPELGSLILFATGAAGFAGYAMARLRGYRTGD